MSGRQALRRVWWAGLAYAGLTVIMTWPMVVRLSSAYAPIEGDFGLWLWDLWWLKKALVDLGGSPYFTSYLYHPTGTSLVFHNLSPYHGLVGIPFQLLGADILMTYNLLYLSSFVLGGVGMLLLVWELTGNLFAAFFAGAVYAFCPLHTIAYAWTNLWALQWLPFALLFALRLLRVGRLLDRLGLAIVLTLATLTDWHQPVLLLLTIIALTLSATCSRRRQGFVRPGALWRLLSSLLVYGLLVSPLAFLALKELAAGDILSMTASWVKILELIGLRNPTRPDGNVISYGVLLGWISLALGTYGIVRGLDFWMKRFAALLIACFVLGLGEALRIPGLAESVLPLPFVLWRKIPLLGIMRGSIYFWIMIQVCVAVLAGYGVSQLWERLESRQQKFPILRPAVGTVLLVLMLTEVCLAPFTPISLRIHPVYEAIQRDGQGGAILDAPIGYTRETVFYYVYYAGWSMYLQTLHNQPLVGGYTQFDSRKRLTFLEQHRILTLFMEPWPSRAEPMPERALQTRCPDDQG